MSKHEVEKTDLEETDEADVEAKLESAGIVTPPDGGYGWIVVIASFFANLLVDGIIFAAGQSLLSIWEREFKTTAMAASWAQSLLGGCYLLAGPIASALANHFGCRMVTIAGSLLAFGGFMLSVLVPALPILYVTFGIVGAAVGGLYVVDGNNVCASRHPRPVLARASPSPRFANFITIAITASFGIGFGLIYLPAIVIVNQYFEKRRAFALGLAVCGSGIGTTIFSQIFPLLLRLNDNNWRTFLMNVAVIVLLCILCGLCFKSPQPDEKQVEEVTKIAEAYHETHPSAKILDSKQVDTSPQTNGTAEMTANSHARETIPTEQFASSHRLANRGLANRPFLSTIELHAAKHNAKDVWSQHDLAKIISKRSMHELNRPLSKMAIFYYGSTVSLSRRTGRTGIRKNRIPSGEQHPSRYLSNLALQATDEGADATNWRQGVRAAMQSMLDISLFTSPSFIILAISGFLTLCCLFVPFIYLGEQASQVGVSKERQAFLLTSLGVTNIVGRIFCGIISDLPSVDPLMVSNVAIIAGGVGTFCVPLLTEYWMYIIYTIPFALAVASFGALRSVICVELLGLERLSSAFGILLLFMGIAALVGPPTAAFLKDLTGNYDLSFYLMGFLMALSGVICIPLRSVSAYEERRRQKAENENQQAELQPLKAKESAEP